MKRLDVTIFVNDNDTAKEVRKAVHNMSDENVSVYAVKDHEYNKGNTLKEIADLFHNGILDDDVYDTDIDMAVAFCLNTRTNDHSYYSKFLYWLADNVEVAHIGDMGMTCKFSELFAEYADKVNPFVKENDWNSGEFDEEDYFFDFVANLDSLIAGYSNESTYRDICQMLNIE